MNPPRGQIVLQKYILPLVLTVRMLLLVSDASIVMAAEEDIITYPHTSILRVVAERFQPEDFLAYTNQIRVERGRSPLRLNDRLNQAARAKVMDMVEIGYWDHFRPGDGKTPWSFIREKGYAYRSAGENLALGFSATTEITDAWLESPAHAANVLSSKYQDVGFSSILVKDQDGKVVIMTVQMFGEK